MRNLCILNLKYIRATLLSKVMEWLPIKKYEKEIFNFHWPIHELLYATERVKIIWHVLWQLGKIIGMAKEFAFRQLPIKFLHEFLYIWRETRTILSDSNVAYYHTLIHSYVMMVLTHIYVHILDVNSQTKYEIYISIETLQIVSSMCSLHMFM